MIKNIDLILVVPEMWDLINIVVPKVKASWKFLTYSMGYNIADVKAIQRASGNSFECCQALFEDWLSTSRGCTPKTWKKLLEQIKAVSELSAAVEGIKKELFKAWGVSFTWPHGKSMIVECDA